MNKTKYIIRSLLSDKAISLFLFMEMFVLIVTTNIALGEYNSRTMLFKPVEPYITKQGFLIYEHTYGAFSTDKHDELSPIIGDKDIDILQVRTCVTPDITFRIIPDKVYERLDLPVSEGSLFSTNNNQNSCQMIVSQNDHGYSAGDTIKTDFAADIKIAAVLTNPTYIMHLQYYYEMSYENMYFNYDKNYYNGIPEMYTCESEFKKLDVDDSYIIINPISIVSFNEQLTDDEYRSIKEKLTAADMTLIDNKDILERSQKILADDFKRFIPAAFVFGIITLIGVLSCSIIGAKTILKKLAVFYCCGANKKDCVIIAAGKMSVIILASGIAAALIIALCKLLRLFNLIGFVFGINNVIVTIGIIMGTIIISAVAPIIQISKTEPREMLTGTLKE